MEKIYLTMPHCDLHQIAESGQCFRWEVAASVPFGGAYIVCDGADQAMLGQLGDGIVLCCESDRVNKWLRYLDAGTDYGEIISSIPSKDKYLHAAAESAAGLRILNADLWEIMVSFIISQNNNIPRIKKTIAAMCEKLGEAREGVYGTYHTFPTPAALVNLQALQGLGLGYRDKYIARLAQNVCYGKIDLAALQMTGACLPSRARAARMSRTSETRPPTTGSRHRCSSSALTRARRCFTSGLLIRPRGRTTAISQRRRKRDMTSFISVD